MHLLKLQTARHVSETLHLSPPAKDEERSILEKIVEMCFCTNRCRAKSDKSQVYLAKHCEPLGSGQSPSGETSLLTLAHAASHCVSSTSKREISK